MCCLTTLLTLSVLTVTTLLSLSVLTVGHHLLSGNVVLSNLAKIETRLITHDETLMKLWHDLETATKWLQSLLR